MCALKILVYHLKITDKKFYRIGFWLEPLFIVDFKSHKPCVLYRLVDDVVVVVGASLFPTAETKQEPHTTTSTHL